MDKLRGRVRAGSHSAEMLTFRRGWVKVPGPIVPGVGGVATPPLPGQAPGGPCNGRVSAASVAQPNSFISRVGEGRQEKRER